MNETLLPIIRDAIFSWCQTPEGARTYSVVSTTILVEALRQNGRSPDEIRAAVLFEVNAAIQAFDLHDAAKRPAAEG